MSLIKLAEQYFEILNTDLAGLNLTAIRTFEDFYNKQILDSVAPFEQSEVFQKSLKWCELVCDVGFGGGFPIIPLAFTNSDCKFIGIEARKKKSEAVNLIINKLNLKNAKTFHKRLEDIHFNSPTVLTFKAVGTVDKFLPLISSSGPIEAYFYKALNFYELEASGIKSIKSKWDIIEEKEIIVPGTEKRILFGVRSKNVPRGTNPEKRELASKLF